MALFDVPAEIGGDAHCAATNASKPGGRQGVRMDSGIVSMNVERQ
jgi:hypothetical protein